MNVAVITPNSLSGSRPPVEMSKPYRKAIDQWRHQSVALLPPATDRELDTVFSGLGMPLSNDVRQLYTTIGGFEDHESVNSWSLWSLSRISSENRGRNSDTLWFADWLISSHVYGIRYLNDDNSEIYLDHNSSNDLPQKNACNMIDFLQKYAENPEDVEAWIVE